MINELSVQEGRLFEECPFKRTVMPSLPAVFNCTRAPGQAFRLLSNSDVAAIFCGKMTQ